MPKVYRPDGATLHPYEFDLATYAGIGALMRACADLEDALDIYLCRSLVIPEATLHLLLGKTPVSTKVKIGAAWSLAQGADASRAFLNFFGDGFSDCLRCRNAAAHGVLLGITNTGELAFAVSQLIPGGPIEATEVICYDPTAFAGFALEATKALRLIEGFLELPALREKRREQSLDPHRKSRPKAHSKTKPPRQPKPSRR